MIALCAACTAELDQAVAGLCLPEADAARIRADVCATVDAFVGESSERLAAGHCVVCALKVGCTCGRGKACGYNRWAETAVARAAHNRLFGRARA